MIATDSANPQNTSEPKLISLRVNNLDEVAPTLAFENTVTTINENTGAGQVILDAIAEDTDFNGSKVIKFSLDGNDANLLSIDQQGQVTRLLIQIMRPKVGMNSLSLLPTMVILLRLIIPLP